MFGYSTNFSYSVLSLKLKSGLFVGIIGISSITGVFTVLENKDSLKNEIEKYTDPVFSFLSEQLDPIKSGGKKILDKGKQWSLSVYGYKDSIYSWIKDTNFSQLKTGANNIYEKIESWSQSIWSLKDPILQWIMTHIKPEQIKKDAKTIYSFFKTVGELWDMLSSMLDKILESSKNIEELSFKQSSLLSSLMEISNSTNPSETISNLITTFLDNSNLISQFNSSDISSVLQFAGKESEKFKEKIEELKNKTADKKWGSYKNTEEFMEDLGLKKQYALSQIASKIKTFTTCPSGKTCTDNDEEIVKNFVELLKSSITDESKKNQLVYSEETDLSDQNNIIVKVITALEEQVGKEKK